MTVAEPKTSAGPARRARRRRDTADLPQETPAAASPAGDDIAKLRQAQAERVYLNNLLRSCSDWIWAVDAAGRIVQLSGALTRIVGQPASRLKGLQFRDFAAWISPEADDLTELQEFKRRTAFRDHEIVLRDPEGGEHRQRVAGVPQFDPDTGNFVGFCGTGIDLSHEAAIEAALSVSRERLEAAMSELRQKNVELQHALAASEAANLAKAGFLAGMSHELRTPLNAVIGYAEALTGGVIKPDSEQQRRISADIAMAGRHLLRLIDDVLEMARLDSDKLKLAMEAVELDAILREALACALPAATDKNMKIEAVAAPEGLRVLVDRVRAVQIFVNLLNNAVKYTPQGAAMGIAVRERGDGQVDVVVWDNGPGIPAAKRDAVFAAFSRVHDDTYKSSAGGTGLGLTISRRLAALMGGWLELRDRAGGGCEFVVRLPLADVAGQSGVAAA